jgi:lysophospholipase L1-like esterase
MPRRVWHTAWRRSLRLALSVGALTTMLACGGPTAPPPPPPPPALTLTCPQNVDVESRDGSPVDVSLAPPVSSGGVAPVNATCSPQSGAFNVGSTPVTCQATDSRGQSASCNFVVAVRAPPRLKFVRFLAFGDSLTEGVVSSGPMLRLFLLQDSYPFLLQRRLAARYLLQAPVVINEGIAGEAATEGSRRLRSRIQLHRPDVLLLMEGTNDLLDRPDIGRGADTAMVALKGMVSEAKLLGVRVAIATVPPQRAGGIRHRDAVASLIPSFNDRIRALAAVENVALIDVYNAMKDDLSLIGLDDLHPTIAGYDVMAGAYFEAIKREFEDTPAPTLGRKSF